MGAVVPVRPSDDTPPTVNVFVGIEAPYWAADPVIAQVILELFCRYTPVPRARAVTAAFPSVAETPVHVGPADAGVVSVKLGVSLYPIIGPPRDEYVWVRRFPTPVAELGISFRRDIGTDHVPVLVMFVMARPVEAPKYQSRMW